MNKKTISTIIGIIFLVYIILNIFYSKNIVWFQQNIFQQTKFETKNFIIDVPKFHWIGKYKDNNSSGQLFFIGIPVDLSKNSLFNSSFFSHFFGNKDYTVLPIMVLDNFTDDTLEALKIYCDESLEKTTQKINNWEAEVYSCVTKSRSDLVDKHIVYKGEDFYTFYYSYDVDIFNNFQSQYNKFFEGVRLKE
ncbi:MAG: hypothetical protein LBL65_08705 [Campylobacteraceae bacterium]|nr:hypothetical protein [Campylobacteraceae bacterium]